MHPWLGRCLLILGLAAPGAPGWAAAPLTLACQAPALPPPAGKVVTVASEPALQAAVGALTSGTTILIQPGTYVLTSTLIVTGGVQNVTLRGATDGCDDVVLIGRGMTNASYGGVPHGVWIGNAQQVLIADLTIRDVYYHPVTADPNAGAQAPHLYNLHLIDAGEQFVKMNASTTGTVGVNDGRVEYSILEYTTQARSAYTNGVDVHQGARWVIRHNLFRNLVAPAGQLAGPAVLLWNGSSDSLVEANLLWNVQYGIALGLDPTRPADHQRGIVRNNFVYRDGAHPGDTGITINNSPGTEVLHNTVLLSGTYPNAIEYRFGATSGVDIRYNLTDGAVLARDGATGTVTTNVTTAKPSWFVNAPGADLHLTAAATLAIDQAHTHPDVLTDYDDQPRPSGAAPDIGADEFGPALAVPAAPTSLRVTP